VLRESRPYWLSEAPREPAGDADGGERRRLLDCGKWLAAGRDGCLRSAVGLLVLVGALVGPATRCLVAILPAQPAVLLESAGCGAAAFASLPAGREGSDADQLHGRRLWRHPQASPAREVTASLTAWLTSR
jgi:hypothetical protein